MKKDKTKEENESTGFFSDPLKGRFEEELHASFPKDPPPDSAAVEKSWVDDFCAQINRLVDLLNDPRAKHVQGATLSQIRKCTSNLVLSRTKKMILWNNN